MTEPAAPGSIDPVKLEQFLHKVIGDFGSALSMGLAYIGDRLGLYRSMAASGPVTSETLARDTGTNERYVREWLINQAAGGYCEYDPSTGRYHLTPEQAMALTDVDGPAYVAGGFLVVKAMLAAVGRIRDDFTAGKGMLWGEHDPDLFQGTERFFRPGYRAHLVTSWIPALQGTRSRLEAGADVADVGCGHGASTRIMARAFPSSRFFGFDSHEGSIAVARKAAVEDGFDERVRFDVADAGSFPGNGYALVTFFDCLHDMGDPVGAMRRAAGALAQDGSVLIVEPMAGERVEENFNAVGRTFSAASTLCCAPHSMAAGGPALGAVAPESRLRGVVLEGGFRTFRRVAETPFNRVYEARL